MDCVKLNNRLWKMGKKEIKRTCTNFLDHNKIQTTQAVEKYINGYV